MNTATTASRTPSLPLATCARLPAPNDNVAIAVRQLDAGTTIELPGSGPRTLAHTVLLGHRFAVRSIARGAPLLSWGMPFGRALRAIAPGEYVCNAIALTALRQRELGSIALPAEPNFADAQNEFRLDAATFQPAEQVAPAKTPGTFRGYRRAGDRGVGTRNYLVILGTSSRTGALARTLAARLQPLAAGFSNLDGIVPVAHTEGGGPHEPNNRAELLRTLAGFLVHPNVAATLALDQDDEPVNNAALREFMARGNYAAAEAPHAFLSVGSSPAAALARGEAIVREWLPRAAAIARSEQPLAALKLGMQCGGSDAFSGVSANPLAALIARELLRHGGAVNQAETDEMIGAEAYMLRHVRDRATAERFLAAIARFKQRLAWHGADFEGNPSGGNRLRGLYNIVLKSLGAAAKKAPDVRLDHVIDYAEPMRAAGFTFMDSPGNDLESMAGQVGAGCNLILFTTGNGSITNFPFVPTIKITTTTTRHELLQREMDLNAGAYLDGAPMADLAAAGFALTREVASGRRSKGELAGHSQVSIWRDWRQTQPDAWRALSPRVQPRASPGAPIAVRRPARPLPERMLQLWPATDGRADQFACDRVGLIFPASICATQIARLAAERLNRGELPARHQLSRFVALMHTEGCGHTGAGMQERLARTFVGYAAHPCAAATLFLEHGCEKVPNDFIREQISRAGLDRDRFGWASVQLDGGIEHVLAKIEAWFAAKLAGQPTPPPVAAGLGALRLGLIAAAPVSDAAAATLAELTATLVAAGATVLIAEDDPLLASPAFTRDLAGERVLAPSLAWGEQPATAGCHVVQTESSNWNENLAGLGACGAQLLLGVVEHSVRPGHPMLPVLQVAARPDSAAAASGEIDGQLSGAPAADVARLLDLIAATAGRRVSPVAQRSGNTDFQITRGLLGVST